MIRSGRFENHQLPHARALTLMDHLVLQNFSFDDSDPVGKSINMLIQEYPLPILRNSLSLAPQRTTFMIKSNSPCQLSSQKEEIGLWGFRCFSITFRLTFDYEQLTDSPGGNRIWQYHGD